MVANKLNISGLMCIHKYEILLNFQEMDDIRSSINPNLKLSMGMSNDYKFALKKQ